MSNNTRPNASGQPRPNAPPPLTATQTTARELYRRGVTPIRVRDKSKAPVDDGWPARVYGSEVEVIAEFVGSWNIGVVLGPLSDGLIDIDNDWPEASVLGSALLQPSWSAGRPLNGQGVEVRHVFYRCRGIASKRYKAPESVAGEGSRCIIEIRSGGAQTIIPPSRHPSGERLRWINHPKNTELLEVEASWLSRRVELIAGASLLVRLWPKLEGARHELTLALVGACVRAGWPDDELWLVFDALLAAAGDTETKDRQRALTDTIAAVQQVRNATGLPTATTILAEVLGKAAAEDVTRALVDWWQLGRQDYEDAPKLPTTKPGHLRWARASSRQITLLCAADVEPEDVEWLWPDWLAKGKSHTLSGPPGCGKTTIAMDIAATVSRGGRWPDGTYAEPGDVLIWSGEDGIADTLVPRLKAHNADLTRIHFISDIVGCPGGPRPFDPALDMPALAERVSEKPPALIVIDPLVSVVAADSHKNAETRRALQPLVDLAERQRCATLGITHLTKGSAGRDPVERVTGSIAFSALARVVLTAAKMAESEGGGRMLLRSKSCIGPDTGGFAYTLEAGTFHDLTPTRIVWGEALQGTARELLATAETVVEPEARSITEEAIEFLRTVLEKGPMLVPDIMKEAKQAGITEKPLRTARNRLRVQPRKQDFSGGWVWELPSTSTEKSSTEDALRDEDAHRNGVGNLGSSSCSRASSSEDDEPWPSDAELVQDDDDQ